MKRKQALILAAVVLAWFVAFALMAFAPNARGQATQPATQPATRPAAPANAIVGVWGVPIRDFATWRARGCNTLVAYEPQNDASGKPTVTIEQWTAAARTATINENNGNAILTNAIARQIKELLPSKTNGELARMYGVARQTINSIRRGDSWKNI